MPKQNNAKSASKQKQPSGDKAESTLAETLPADFCFKFKADLKKFTSLFPHNTNSYRNFFSHNKRRKKKPLSQNKHRGEVVLRIHKQKYD